MANDLRHSHIAVRASLADIARHLGTEIESGVDDLGPYTFTDVRIVDDDSTKLQEIRFASREGDSLTHLLAEDIHAVPELAFILYLAGVRDKANLSISVDHQGRPVRSVDAIYNRIAALSLPDERARDRFNAAG